MRVINFNIKGVRAPRRIDHATQERSWHLLAAHNADLEFVQKVKANAIPDWVRQRWTIVQGDPGIIGNASAGLCFQDLAASRPLAANVQCWATRRNSLEFMQRDQGSICIV